MRKWLIAALVVALLGLVGVIAAILIVRPWESDASPNTIAIRGTVALVDSSDDPSFAGTLHECHGTGGYSDLSEGAQVVVMDDQGNTLAITELRDGVLQYEGCKWQFSASVPTGKGYYGVQVTHRGVVKEPESDLADVQLTIGD